MTLFYTWKTYPITSQHPPEAWHLSTASCSWCGDELSTNPASSIPLEPFATLVSRQSSNIPCACLLYVDMPCHVSDTVHTKIWMRQSYVKVLPAGFRDAMDLLTCLLYLGFFFHGYPFWLLKTRSKEDMEGHPSHSSVSFANTVIFIYIFFFISIIEL